MLTNKSSDSYSSHAKDHGLIKILILKLFQSTPSLWITGHFRPLTVLRLVKAISRVPGGTLLVGLFDPNVIRKKLPIKFKQRLVSLKSNGGAFLVDVNEHLGYRFFINNGFDPLVLEVSEFLEIDDKSILLDIGANIGSTCIPFAIKYNAEVIAVEASKQNAFLLLKNASLNKIRIWPHINCAVDGATANKDKWLKFFTSSGNSAANSIFESWNPSKSESDFEFVKTATMDKLLMDVDLKKIKLIKIDVEGAEEIVLRGFESISLTEAPMLFEYRVDVMKRDLNDDGLRLVKLIEKNFYIYGIRENQGSFWLCDFDPKQPYANAIAIPKARKEYFLDRLPSKLT